MLFSSTTDQDAINYLDTFLKGRPATGEEIVQVHYRLMELRATGTALLEVNLNGHEEILKIPGLDQKQLDAFIDKVEHLVDVVGYVTPTGKYIFEMAVTYHEFPIPTKTTS